MNIGPKTIDKMKAMAAEQIDAYAKKIDEAFLKSNDGRLKVNISYDLYDADTKPGGLEIDATIGFTMERVKDKISSTVMENQADLPLETKVYELKK